VADTPVSTAPINQFPLEPIYGVSPDLPVKLAIQSCSEPE